MASHGGYQFLVFNLLVEVADESPPAKMRCRKLIQGMQLLLVRVAVQNSNDTVDAEKVQQQADV